MGARSYPTCPEFECVLFETHDQATSKMRLDMTVAHNHEYLLSFLKVECGAEFVFDAFVVFG